MSIQVALHHRTTYRYDRPTTLGPQVIRLRPAPHCRSRVLSYALSVLPGEHFLNWQQDPQANYLARLVFPEKTRLFEVRVDVVVEMASYNPFDFFLEPYAEHWPFAYDPSLELELAPYLRTLPPSPLFDAFLARVRPKAGSQTSDMLVELNRALSEHVAYKVRLEPGLQSPEETLALRSGSCRDSGWLLVQILRHLGFAARFASGYLIQLVADLPPLEGPPGPTADFCDLHAWCEVYLPGAGWIGLDPTSGLLAGEGHLPLACTAEPSLAAPISGLLDPCETVFEHEMSVTRVVETPRVTKPYSEAEWAAVLALGRKVDDALRERDVRLTMGGEPTFVSIDHPDSPEWNTDALGPEKRRLSKELFFRLRTLDGPHGIVHFGQGKWYPGEPLPRWSMSLFTRRDGAPLWNDPALVADEDAPSGATESHARELLLALAETLALPTGHVFPAYEDVAHYLLRERRLPINVDPRDPKLADPLEREKLRALFTRGLGAVSGYVLPLVQRANVWKTGPWHFRGGACFLVPGDSPIGLRLPLDTLPWVAPEDLDPVAAADPSRALPPLSESLADTTSAPTEARAAEADTRVPAVGESAKDSVRQAICAEARKGVLHVFVPPVDTLEAYIELVSALERAAKRIGTPILLEGYPPPRDPRLVAMSVTPDPGVVEVNVAPSASWDELVGATVQLYEAARLSRLTAEKFMVDGRHVGTGGGNHVVLGAASPQDSPFLRRPDLLASLIAYFHQHPSLSYLFSGMFIGPTSQAPRVDEARHDALFEMEIAFLEVQRGLERHEDAPPPWLVDRLFRDLLTDVTGNTHRAEICIDKLYSPDGSAGRLGLVELRAFEMPPHARMSLTQMLVLRALVARLWSEPFAPKRLTRWGTELHDRFMLPHFVWQDFEDVLEDLARAGFPLEPSWFLPHFEFRFPRIGDCEIKGVTLSLRAALEPWHVMGEDAAAGGTARYVDSSLERVEVKLTGLAPDRYVVTCNGAPVPLRPTGHAGEFVAGVRFRAWQPPRCLHPHIGVDSPLVFDLVDTWTERSLGGCKMHVVHPGGRSYDVRPLNALEAEGRRGGRFSRLGHTPGKVPASALTRGAPSLDFPFTLDLRTVRKIP